MKNRTSETNHTSQFEEIQKSFRTQLSDSISTIEEIAKRVDPVRLFVSVFANMCFGSPEHMTEINYGTVPVKIELLAYYLYPFFASTGNEAITPFHVNASMEALDKLHIAYIWSEGFNFKIEKHGNVADWIASEVRVRALMVRGSAYPEQTQNEILSIQGFFEDWFAKRLGIGPTRACSLLFAIMKAQEDRYNDHVNDFKKHAEIFAAEWKENKKKWLKDKSKAKPTILQVLKKKKTAWLFGYFKRLNELVPDIIPVGLADLNMKHPPSVGEWESLKNIIGLTKENREEMTEPIDVRKRVLFFLPDNKVILTDISHVLDLLWESFEKVARSDKNFYDKRYQRKKAQWLENKTVENFLRLFPLDRIFRNLDYPDPDKPEGSTAELDLAVDWGPFLLLIEVKAKQFRIESQLGDVGRLRTDIKENVEDAFEQARRVVKYISSSTSPEFLERGTGRKLTIKKSRIRRIYLITVSQHHLSGLATELASLKDLGLFKDEEYPLAISECDLDIISELCDAPDIFLHYIERRLDIQKQSIEILADELDFFAAYLDCRLQASRLWQGESENVNHVALTGYSDAFDRLEMYKRGDLDESPEICLKVPDEIRTVLKELRERDDDGARWIAFALLDMTDNSLGGIATAFRELREAQLTPGMFRRLVHKDGDMVISFTVSLDLPARMLRERNAIRVQVEKYKHKVSKSIGFGIMALDKGRFFDCAAYAEGPWIYDEKIEEVIATEPPYMLAPGQKLPSKKSPCPCGSGKRFEECCLPKYQV